MTHPKSPELLQAQVAAFASDRISNPTSRDHVLADVTRIALGPMADVVRTTDANEYERTPSGYNVTPANTEVVAGSAEDYLSYLRDRDASGDQVSRRATLLESYRQFDYLADVSTEHLGSGSRADVRRIVSDGREYAVRIPRNVEVDVPAVEHKVRAALRGQGIPHLEQLVAVSYEKGRTVSEIMPGTELSRLSATELARSLTDEQIDTFIETLAAAYEAGISVDPKPSNIFYDTDDGFGIIDYQERVSTPGRSEVTLADTIGHAAYAIAGTGIDGRRLIEPDYREYAREQRSASLTVLRRFQERCRARFAEDGILVAVNDAVQSRIDAQEAQTVPQA